MNTNMNNPTPDHPDHALDAALMERDLLITRIIDGEGSGAAWERFASVAGSDASAWRELALAQRQHLRLTAAVRREIAVAVEIDLPISGERRAPSRSTVRAAQVARKWTGWAVAAAITLAWGGAMLTGVGPSGPPLQMGTAGPTGVAAGWQPQTTQDALNAYLEVGQKTGNVIGEVPNWVMIESRPASGGTGFEVVYLRQFMERAVVPDLYRFGQDERGGRVVVPVSQPRPGGKL